MCQQEKLVRLLDVVRYTAEVAVVKKRAEGESRARANTRSRLVDAAIEILVERGVGRCIYCILNAAINRNDAGL